MVSSFIHLDTAGRHSFLGYQQQPARSFSSSSCQPKADNRQYIKFLVRAMSDKSEADDWQDEKSVTEARNYIIMTVNSSVRRTTMKEEEQQQDLFVPIFSLASIAGFTAAYAYETFRLYQNGELYLPFMNH